MATKADTGFFGYQQVMDDFYNYEPDKEDSEGRSIKRNFQANMVQSGFDAALSESMAQTQSQLAQSNMITAADLEQRNTAANMQQEFNYGQQSLGTQFELQDKFADNQNERDLGTLTATGEQQRLTQNSKGLQDRQTAIVQGEQSRKLADVQGSYNTQQANISADASKYGSKQAADASKYQSNASVTNTKTQAASQDRATAAQERASNYGANKTFEASKLQTEASVTNTNTQARSQDKATDAQERSTDKQTAASITNTNTQAEANKYGADKSAQASMYGADATKEASMYQSDATIRNTTETGKQQRETMGYQDKLEAGKENRQAARSRTMARAF
jgi:hypothetical protein